MSDIDYNKKFVWTDETKLAVTNVINKFLSSHNVQLLEGNYEYVNDAYAIGEDCPAVILHTNREIYHSIFKDNDLYDLLKPIQSVYGWFDIYIKEKTPPLVGAKVGDWVLIYENGIEDDQLSLGLVTSVNNDGEKATYGCSYILPTIYNSWFLDNNLKFEKFEITEEDHGGYHDGFVKVLTVEEAKDILLKNVHSEYKKLKDEIKNVYQNSVRRAPDLVDELSGLKVVEIRKNVLTNPEDIYIPELKNSKYLRKQ